MINNNTAMVLGGRKDGGRTPYYVLLHKEPIDFFIIFLKNKENPKGAESFSIECIWVIYGTTSKE